MFIVVRKAPVLMLVAATSENIACKESVLAKVCTEMAVSSIAKPDYFHANFHLLLSFQLSTSDIRRLCCVFCQLESKQAKCLLGYSAPFFGQILHIKL